MPPYHYFAFGLRLTSDLELPELATGEAGGEVSIELGDVPETLEEPTGNGVYYQVSPNQFLLNVPDAARYLVSDGSRITVQRLPGAGDATVRVFLLGSAFGALLHQRGALPIHGSAIATPRGAVIFSGPSGIGKSTLAWEFHRRGYRHLSDDVSVVSFAEGGRALVHPAYPQMSLWADVLDRRGQARDSLRPVHDELNKFALPTRERFESSPVPLAAIYILSTTNTSTFAITPLTGLEKLRVLLANTYRRRFLNGMSKRTEHFQLAAAAGQFLRACRVERPTASFQLDALADLIEKDWAA
jgi:hypothetical protein